MLGEGTIQTTRAIVRHSITANCLLENVLRILAGMYRLDDNRDGTLGDIQNVDDDDRELADNEDEDECPEGTENIDPDN